MDAEQFHEQLQGINYSELQKNYIAEKLQPHIQQIVKQVLVSLPPDPAAFMIQYVRKSILAGRYKVVLRADGRTSPLSDGKPRRILPEANNAPGWEWDSRPFLRLRVSDTSSDNAHEAPVGDEFLFLIDSGATSAAQWSPSLKKSLAIPGPENESQTATLYLKSEKDQAPWQWSETAQTRVKGGIPSPHPHSVLGTPWMAAIRPYFDYEGSVPPAEERVVVRFPKGGGKATVCVKLGRKGAAREEFQDACMVVDTGCVFSTFPKAFVHSLGLEKAITESFPDGCKKTLRWFESESRDLFRVTFADAETGGDIWTLTNPLGSTARENEWGLLGMDWLLAVRPLILYEGFESEHSGEFNEDMIMQAVGMPKGKQKRETPNPVLQEGDLVEVVGNTASRGKVARIRTWDEARSQWQVKLPNGNKQYFRSDQLTPREFRIGENVEIVAKSASKGMVGRVDMWDESQSKWLVKFHDGKGSYFLSDQMFPAPVSASEHVASGTPRD